MEFKTKLDELRFLCGLYLEWQKLISYFERNGTDRKLIRIAQRCQWDCAAKIRDVKDDMEDRIYFIHL